MIDATQIRKGMIIIMDGTLWRVMEMQLITPGRWKAMVQTKLRNIQNGSQTEHRFRSEEKGSSRPASTRPRWNSSTSRGANTSS